MYLKNQKCLNLDNEIDQIIFKDIKEVNHELIKKRNN